MTIIDNNFFIYIICIILVTNNTANFIDSTSKTSIILTIIKFIIVGAAPKQLHSTIGWEDPSIPLRSTGNDALGKVFLIKSQAFENIFLDFLGKSE